MNQPKKISFVLDGSNAILKLVRPLPSGFKLDKVLSGANAKATFEGIGEPDAAQKAEEAVRENHGYMATEFIVGDDKLTVFVVVPIGKGEIESYLFGFSHRGMRSLENAKCLVVEVIKEMVTRLHFAKVGEQEKEAMFGDLAINHLNAEELEQLADVEQAIEDLRRVRQELINAILRRESATEKPSAVIEMLRKGLPEAAEIPPEQLEETVQKMSIEDVMRLRVLSVKMEAAKKARFELLDLGAQRADEAP